MFAVRVFSFAIARQFQHRVGLRKEELQKLAVIPSRADGEGSPFPVSRHTSFLVLGYQMRGPSLLLGMTCYTMPGTLNARTPATAVARVSHRSPFRFDLRQPSATLHFHDLISQQS